MAKYISSRNILMLTLGLTFIQLISCGQRVDVVLSGRNIQSNDLIWGNSEPFIKVYYKFDDNSNYISFGQTGVKKGQKNPNWTEQFTFDYVANSDKIQHAKFELWDKDWLYDDHLGDVVISLEQLVSEAGNNADGVVNRVFNTGKGTLLIKTTLGPVTGQLGANVMPNWILGQGKRS